jgi:EAL and modified HD-GYP domain-containing signal transduction protein
MNVFLARQPIFNKDLSTYGYELLYRNSEMNAAQIDDGTSASSDVIANSLLAGLDKVSDDKPSFIKFTESLILDEVATVFDPQSIVIEILNSINVTSEVLTTCQNLKSKGYKFALEGYTPQEFNENLLKLVDILKVDFQALTTPARSYTVKQVKSFDVKLLAEKIETYEDLSEAQLSNYNYFQGYFFQKPEIIKNNELSESSHIYLRIMNEFNQEVPQFKKITRIIETDVSLTYRILKLVNSPAFYSVQKIDSIENALVRIGLKEIKKIISILMLKNVNSDKPVALTKQALIRAKFAELISKEMDLNRRSTEFFMMGLFSMMDALMDCDIETAIADLPLNDDLKSALMGEKNRFRDILDLIKLYERGYWELISRRCTEYSLNEFTLPTLYLEAVTWTHDTTEL